MKSLIKLFVTTILTVACSWGIAQSKFDIHLLQKQLISKMSGVEKLNDSTTLEERGTSADRKRAAELLAEALEEISLDPEEHNYSHPNVNFLVDLLFAPYKGTNVYAVIPATSASDEFVIIGAHYDSEVGAPGADDNATGVALVYALAYQISLMDHRARNFMVVFFDQEESDEIGSKAFARKLKREGVNVHSVHIADMVGWDGDGDFAIEISPASSVMAPVYEEAAKDQGLPVQKTNVMSSDHKSFHDVGYPSILVSEEFVNGDFNPYYHSPEDTYDTINFEYLSSCTELMYGVMDKLASEK